MSALSVLLQEAQSEFTAPERLWELAAKENPAEVRRACAANPMTPLEVLNDLAAEFPSAFLANPTTQLRLLDMEELLEELPEKSCIALASCPDSPACFIQMLVKSITENPRGIDEIVNNLSCPPETLLLVLIESCETWSEWDKGQDLCEDLRNQIIKHPNFVKLSFEELSQHTNWLVRSTVALHPDCSPEILSTLADQGVTEAALNPNCPPNSLIKLVHEILEEAIELWNNDWYVPDEYYQIMMTIADNPICSSDLLSKLSEIKNWDIRISITENPNCSPELLSEIILRLNEIEGNEGIPVEISGRSCDLKYFSEVYEFIIDNPKFPLISPVDLEKMADSKHACFRYEVARADQSPPSALSKLAEDEDDEVREEVASNLNCSPETLAKLAQDNNPFIRLGVAYNVNCSPKTLEKLAADEEYDIRKGVAGHPSFLKLSMEALSRDPSERVRSTVAMCLECPPEILDKLSNDESYDVRVEVADNPGCPSYALIKLVESWSGVDEFVARHPNCPPELLADLATSENRWIRQGVAGNPNCPSNVLEALAKDEDESVRNIVIARNPGCTPDILTILSEDNNPTVREIIAGNPNCPPEILIKLARAETLNEMEGSDTFGAWPAALAKRRRQQQLQADASVERLNSGHFYNLVLNQ